jgi:hypothetical protein
MSIKLEPPAPPKELVATLTFSGEDFVLLYQISGYDHTIPEAICETEGLAPGGSGDLHNFLCRLRFILHGVQEASR